MAQQKMHCALQRTHTDNQEVSDRGQGYSTRKSIQQDNFRSSSKDSDLLSPYWRNSDHRYSAVTFFTLESDGHWRVVSLPLRCLDHPNQSGSGAQVNMDGLHQVSPPSINSFKVDRRKTWKGPPPDVNYSFKPFTVRSFPGSNVQHQSCNRTLANKVTKLNELSCSLPCQSSITCSDSSALIPKGSNAIKPSDMFIDDSKADKTVKRSSRKKARKKGKQNKKPSCDTGATEPEVFSEYAHGSSTSETYGNNDIDHDDRLVSYASSPEVSLSDGRVGGIHFQGNSNGIVNFSESTCSSYTYKEDVSKATVPSMEHNLLGENPVIDYEIGVQMKDQGFSSFGGVEDTDRLQISCYSDMHSKGFSYRHDSLVVDSVSVGSNSDNDTNASHDVKSFHEENSRVCLAEPPDFYSRKGYFSRRNSLNCVVDTGKDSEGTKHGIRNLSSSDMLVVAPIKRDKQVETVSGSPSTCKLGSAGNSHSRTGKENNHSVWKKVQRNDADHCNFEFKNVSPVCSEYDIKEATLLKRNCGVAEVNMLAKAEDNKQLKYKVCGKLKRKTGPGAKQEYNSYSRRGSYPSKASSKISMQQKELLDISAQTNDKKGSSTVSRSHAQIGCPRVVFKTGRVECMNSELVHGPQVFSDEPEPLESLCNAVSGMNNLCNAVSGMNNQSVESKESSIVKSCGSLDQSNLLEVRSPVYLPHLLVNGVVKMEKEISSSEHSKQSHSSGSGSIMQKWIPIGTKDHGLTTSAKSKNSSLEHFDAPGAEDWTLRNTVVEKAAPDPQTIVSSVKAEIICMAQGSGNVDSASQEDESQIQMLRNLNEGTLKENINMHVAANCLTSESEDQFFSAFESDLDRIAQAVNDSCRVQLVSEAVQKATGGPIAEFERLLHFTSPIICNSHNFISCKTCSPEQVVDASLCRHETPNISLGCLWQWYEKHGSYGLEVRAEDFKNSKRLGVDRFAFRAYFVPFLSAVQLFRNRKSHSTKNSNRASTPGVLEARQNGETSENSSNVSRLSIFSVLVPQPRVSDASNPLLVNDVCGEEPSLAPSKEDSSIQSVDMAFSNDLELLFEYFETEPPQQRRPLYEKIQELVRDGPLNGKAYGDPSGLNSTNLHDLHPRSWYSVAWYPIYRIPEGNFRAAFLTYHSLGHWFRRSTQFDSSSVDSCVVSPVVGLQSYNTQGECWFQIRNSALSQTAETPSLNPSGILKERLRTLEETASLMARAVVNKGIQTSINRQPDYEFFSRRR